jgi:PST family polysaccharide transporter
MTFSRIFRLSALMGGASAVAMATGLIRGKLIAVTLGPAGVGMMGVLNQLITTLAQILGFGIGNSAVRYVAGAEGVERERRESVTYAFSLKLAVVAVAVSLIAAVPACWATFGDFDNLPIVLVASLTAPAVILATAIGALLLARGPTVSVAKAQIYSSIFAFIVGVPLILFGGMWGLVWALVAALATPLLIMRGFIRLSFPGWRAVFRESSAANPLIVSGFALIGTIIVGQLSAYLTRLAIVHQLGLDHAGYYQAAFSIAGNIPAFVFAAMSTDFYPRVAAAKDETEALEATERQIKAGIMLATPCFIGLILFSQQLLDLFYTDQFMSALALLRWMIWGVACRLVSWPMGYWLLARAKPKELFLLEGAGACLVMALTFAFVPWLGLLGSGIAFALGALTYGVCLSVFMRRRCGRTLSAECLRWSAVAILSLALAQFVAMQGLGMAGLTLALMVISAPSLAGAFLALKKSPHA